MTHVGPTAQSTRAATPGQKRADISQVLEQTMRRVSTAVSVVTVLLMLTGFIITVLTHPALNPTGQAALAPSRLFRPVQEEGAQIGLHPGRPVGRAGLVQAPLAGLVQHLRAL